MSDRIKRLAASRDRDELGHRPPKAAEFQEVPGEAEAEAVRDAFLRGAGPALDAQAAALAQADGATQVRALALLQRERGNAYVQRLLSIAREPLGTPGRLVGLSQAEMVEEVHRRQDGGSPLPDETRRQMEGYFGADLGQVRIHTGGAAAALSRELNAKAFTVGSDIFFGDGQYDPASIAGQATLAHELTHVRQQGGFGPAVPGVQREDEATGADEAEQVQALRSPHLQRAAAEEEEEVQTLREPAIQRQSQQPEDEEPQLRRDTAQRQSEEEEEAGT